MENNIHSISKMRKKITNMEENYEQRRTSRDERGKDEWKGTRGFRETRGKLKKGEKGNFKHKGAVFIQIGT